MSKLIIEGGVPLCGVIGVQGAKNSVLPILAATLLCEGECIIDNCPDISDTYSACEILRSLGGSAFSPKIQDSVNTFYVNSSFAAGFVISEELMRKMRSSVIFLGPLLARFGKAIISSPGGCELGPRPIDLHLSSLCKLGVTVSEEHGYLSCEAKELHGAEINLSFPSVGATENIILAAVKANGKTVINNAAKEPEIEDLQNFLNKAGADISGGGTGRITVNGVKKINGVRYRVIPDRIAAGTYLCATAITHGNILLKNVCPEHISSVISFLSDCGCEIEVFDDSVSLSCDKLSSGSPVRTMPYPGFPTDMQAIVMAAMTLAKGNTVFVETIFENRYKHIGELRRMGAKITADGRVAVVEGVKKLYGASVECPDLRGGAALMVAALAAEGTTVIENIRHIDRGYEKPESVLSSLGAKIKREK